MQSLRMADPPLIQILNSKLKQGELESCSGQKVAAPLQAGLVREDGRVFYPIRDGIPILLEEEGVLL